MFSENAPIQKNFAHLSILSNFQHIYKFYLCFCFFQKLTSLFFLTFNDVSNNIKPITKVSLEFYTRISITHLTITLLSKKEHKNTTQMLLWGSSTQKRVVFSKTFYSQNCMQDFISIHFVFCGRHEEIR